MPFTNSLRRECEAALPPEVHWMKPLHVSPSSQYRAVNEELEWIRRSTSNRPRGGSVNRPWGVFQTSHVISRRPGKLKVMPLRHSLRQRPALGRYRRLSAEISLAIGDAD